MNLSAVLTFNWGWDILVKGRLCATLTLGLAFATAAGAQGLVSPSLQSPAAGSSGDANVERTFVVNFTDAAGAADVNSFNFEFFSQNYADSPVNKCIMTYYTSIATLDFYNDAATSVTSGYPGGSTILSNSQCSLDMAHSSVQASGNTLTFTLAVTFTPSFQGPWTMWALGVNSAGEYSAWNSLGTYTVTTPLPSVSIWSSSATPQNPLYTASPVTLGEKFRSDVSGNVTALRFYKGAGNNGTHIGLLYDRAGDLLAQATFTGETASGWQQVNLPTPVTIAANTTYIVGYFSTSGFAYDANYFASSGFNNPPLHALEYGVDGPNGVFVYASTVQFPTGDGYDENFWADVAFSAAAPDLTIASSHTGNFTQGQTGATYAITVSNIGSAASSGTVTATDTLPSGLTATATSGTGWSCSGTTCTRSDALAAGAGYPAITVTVNVAASAAAGVTNTATVSGGGETNTANDVGSDMTAIQGSGPGAATSIWSSSAVPQNPLYTASPVTLGEKFRSDVAGSITALRFYKGAGNNGLHIGLLYDRAGDLLAQATFTGETASGWQQVNLATPVSIAANTTYIVGYFSNSGFAYDANYFASSGFDNPPLHALEYGVDGPNGVYVYASTVQFPTGDGYDENFWADVVFARGSALTITSTHSGSFMQGQNGAAYTLTVSNQAGASATSGSVTVTDTLPAGLTLAAMSGSGWTCSSSACTRSDVLATGASFPAISVVVNVAPNAAPSVTNQVSVSGGGSVAASGSDTTAITAEPALTIVSTHSGIFTQGQQSAAYSLTVTNGGAVTTTSAVTVTDTIPTGLTFGSMSGSGWSCSGNVCTRSDTLASGASYPPITASVNVASNAPGAVNNQASVAGGGGSDGPAAIDPTTIAALSLIPVSPNSGALGSQIFTVTASDSVSVADLTSVFLLIGANPTGVAGACYARYDLATNSLFLADDNGNWQPGVAVGSAGFLENSQCLLRADSSTAAPSGNYNLAAGFSLAFKPAFNGAKNVYAAVSNSAASTAMLQEGTWTVAQPLSVTSVTPNSGSGPGETFTAVFTDANGAANLTTLRFWVGSAISGATTNAQNSCLLNYSLSTGQIGLLGDNGSTWSYQPLGVGAMNNSRCSVNLAGTSVVVAGATATLTLPLSFSAAYAGAMNVLAYADDATQNSGWYKVGTWTATAPAWPALSVTSAHSGSFSLGQGGAAYALTVSNAVFATPTDGTQVTVTETLPTGLALATISGSGWTCPSNTCTRSDALQPGASYPPITVTVNVAASALSPSMNAVSVIGGGSAAAEATDSTTMADFSISLAAAGATTILAGGSTTFTITATPGTGFTASGGFTFAALGLPTGSPTPTFTSGPGANQWTMTVTMPASGAPSPVIQVVGTAGTLSHTSGGVGLVVQDYTITVSPLSSSSAPIGVTGGQTITFTASATGLNGYSAPVGVTLSLPFNCQCAASGTVETGSVTPGGGSVNLYWVLPSNSPIEIENYTISGSSSGIAHTVTGQASVAAEDLSLTLVQTPIQTTSSPGSANFTLTATSLNNFAGNVAFSLALPSGWGPVNPSPLSLSAGGTAQETFTVTVPRNVSPGVYSMAIEAVDGLPYNRSATAALSVGSNPAPALTVTSTQSGSFALGQTGTYTITVSNQAGAGTASGAVTVTDALPAGLTLVSMGGGSDWSCSGNTCSNNNTLGGGGSYSAINVVVNVAANAPSVVYNQVNVTGGGSVATSTTNTTTISAGSTPSFTLTASPASQTVIPGGTTTYTIAVAASGTFNNNAVTLSMGAISGASASLSSTTVAPGGTATLTVNTFASTNLGPITILVTGTSGTLTNSVSLGLNVQALTLTQNSTPVVLANNVASSAAIYNVNNGDARWITDSSCDTGDSTITAAVVAVTASTLTLQYKVALGSSSTYAQASCTYACPGGRGHAPLPPITVSPAPSIAIGGVTDAEGNPNPVVQAGVPTTIYIHGQYFGATRGNLEFCLAGASPCVFPTNLCNPGCGSWTFPTWTDGLIAATVTLPPDTDGQLNVYVISNLWILGAALANPSRGLFTVIPPQPTVSLTPTDLSGYPGDVFTFTATGATPGGASGSFVWTITEDAQYPGSFNFVSSTCASGATCAPVSPPTCAGSSTCTAYLQGAIPGFANLGVVFQVASAQSQPATGPIRAIIPTITKIWSDQFPGGQVANYLPGDGTPANPNGSGAGAGLVGNARQLLNVGPGQNPSGSFFSSGYNYVQANVVTLPNTAESFAHVLVQLQPGAPNLSAGTPPQVLFNPAAPTGLSSHIGSTFTVTVGTGLTTTDYSIVAGVDPGGGTLTPQQHLNTFAKPCLVTIPQGQGVPCSNGAVRIVSSPEALVKDKLEALAGSAFVLLPNASNMLASFATGAPPVNAFSGLNPTAGTINIDNLQLYYNDGLTFTGYQLSTGRYFGSVPLFPFLLPSSCGAPPATTPCTGVGAAVQQNSDFQQLIKETLEAHRQEVMAYFSNPANANSTYQPAVPWQAIGCSAVLGAGGTYGVGCNLGGPTAFGTTALGQVDLPTLFPCVPQAGELSGTLYPAGLAGTLPPGLNLNGVECDLTFSQQVSLNLFWAFGRTGYNFTVLPTINAQLGVVNISLSGSIYDIYQWNFVQGGFDNDFQNLQATYLGPSPGTGQVFVSTVQIDTPALSGFNFTIR